MLARPPGSGKTTLARIIAKHCGYNSVEVKKIFFLNKKKQINASDDRSAEKLINRIETMSKNEALNFGND